MNIKDEIVDYLVDPYEYEDKGPIGKGGFMYAILCEKTGTGGRYVRREIKEDVSIQILREIYILTIDYPTIMHLEGWSMIEKLNIYTKYMERGTLSDLLLEPSMILTPTQKQIILYGISKGMEFLHNNKILNRDLKPGNILFDCNLYPKINDFNLSKFTSNIEKGDQSNICGTPKYYSPELEKRNLDYNYKVDVFSFGCVMYEVITNKMHNCASFKEEAKNDELLKQEKYSVFKDLVLKCLKKNPEKRPNFKEITEILYKNYLPEVDTVVFGAYSNNLNNFKPERKVIQMPESNISLWNFYYDEGCKQKNGKYPFKTTSLFKLSHELGYSDDVKKEYNKSLVPLGKYYLNKDKEELAFDMFKKAADKKVIEAFDPLIELLIKKGNDYEANCRLKTLTQLIENNNNNFHDSYNLYMPNKKIYNFDEIDEKDRVITAVFQVKSIVKVSCITILTIEGKDKKTKELKIFGEITESQSSVIQQKSWIASDKIQVYFSEGISQLYVIVRNSQIAYFRKANSTELIEIGAYHPNNSNNTINLNIPNNFNNPNNSNNTINFNIPNNFNNFNNFNIPNIFNNCNNYVFTNFQDIVKYQHLNKSIEIIAEVVYIERDLKSEKCSQYHRMHLIDDDFHQVTATVFDNPLLKSFNNDEFVGKPVVFRNVQFQEYKGIINMKTSEKSSVGKVEFLDLSFNKYDESYKKAKEGHFYKNVLPIAKTRKINEHFFDSDEKSTYFVEGRVISISFKSCEFVHLDRNIIDHFKDKIFFKNTENKDKVLDNRSREMIPQISLNVSLADPGNEHNLIWVCAKRPEIVKYLLRLLNESLEFNDDSNNILFSKYLNESKEESEFITTVSHLINKCGENKKVDSIEKMLIRIYGDNRQKVGCIEKIYKDSEKEDDTIMHRENEIYDVLGQINEKCIYYNEKKLIKNLKENGKYDDIVNYARFLAKIKRSYLEASEYYEKAVKHPHSTSEIEYEYGLHLVENIKNTGEGIHLIQKAADAENKKAKLYLEQNDYKTTNDQKIRPY